ncbi:hypothetical protein HHK36_009488 [Tetracentron sinense]|uniref:Uncharacterized protein n=1 Tax=Tetracentron sinense TaxID=13715 RepID=A0A834ZJ13_TETSI|nr:hypothetical protein HHK36_009488 [Tetracentron sinense]
MGRSPCCDENGLKKGPWTPEEDQKLVHYIQEHGHGSWRALPKLAGLYLFSSLPQLLALANLRDFMEHHPWEEHAVRLKTEASQLARLQYIQLLLQSSNSMTTSSYSQTSITDMEAFTMLNSISPITENPILNSSLLEIPTTFSLGISTTQPLRDLIPFSHLPDLQMPCNFQTPLNSKMGQGSLFPVFNQEDNITESPWLPPSLSPPPPTTETSISNPGDACSTSSYGGEAPSFWPDQLLLEDPFMINEIAYKQSH